MLCKVLSGTSSPLSSIISKLEREGERVDEEGEDKEENDVEMNHKDLQKEAEEEVAAVWREIHGENDWVGLLDPWTRFYARS